MFSFSRPVLRGVVARLESLVLLLVLTAAAAGSAAEYLVADRATNQVLRYRATDGSLIGPLVDNNMATNGGLFLPSAMTIGFDGDLFVTSIDLETGDGRVLRYDAQQGTFKGVFASGLIVPAGLLYHEPTQTLLVSSLGMNLGDSNVISQFSANGTRLPDLALGPVSGRTAMVVGPDGKLYASSFAEGQFFSGAVLEYRWNQQGAAEYQGVFATNPQLMGANGLSFAPDGDLYVASLFGQAVVRFDLEQGAVVGSGTLGNLPYPSGVLPGLGDQLLVTSLGNNNPNDPIYPNVFPGAVFRFDTKTGAMIGQGPFLQLGNEFQPTSILLRGAGDFNGDLRLEAADIDALTAAVRAGTNDPQFDLTADGLVNQADRLAWVNRWKRTYVGDANLDGQFNSSDFVAVFEAGQFEDGVTANSQWAQGDWDGDGEFSSSDFIIAFQEGGYEQAPRARAIAIVPEPSSALLLALGCAALAAQRWRRAHAKF